MESQFTSFEEETFDAQVGRPINAIESEYEDLLEELCMKVEMDGELREQQVRHNPTATTSTLCR